MKFYENKKAIFKLNGITLKKRFLGTMIDYAENGVVKKGHSFAHSSAPQHSAPLRSVPLRFAPLHSAPLHCAPLAGSLVSGKVAMN